MYTWTTGYREKPQINILTNYSYCITKDDMLGF